MDSPEFREKSRTLRSLAHFQLLYAIFTLFVSLATMLIGHACAGESLLFPELQRIGVVLIGLGVYGLVAAALMLRARGELAAAALGVLALSFDETIATVLGAVLITAALLNLLALARGASPTSTRRCGSWRFLASASTTSTTTNDMRAAKVSLRY